MKKIISSLLLILFSCTAWAGYSQATDKEQVVIVYTPSCEVNYNYTETADKIDIELKIGQVAYDVSWCITGEYPSIPFPEDFKLVDYIKTKGNDIVQYEQNESGEWEEKTEYDAPIVIDNNTFNTICWSVPGETFVNKYKNMPLGTYELSTAFKVSTTELGYPQDVVVKLLLCKVNLTIFGTTDEEGQTYYSPEHYMENIEDLNQRFNNDYEKCFVRKNITNCFRAYGYSVESTWKKYYNEAKGLIEQFENLYNAKELSVEQAKYYNKIGGQKVDSLAILYEKSFSCWEYYIYATIKSEGNGEVEYDGVVVRDEELRITGLYSKHSYKVDEFFWGFDFDDSFMKYCDNDYTILRISPDPGYEAVYDSKRLVEINGDLCLQYDATFEIRFQKILDPCSAPQVTFEDGKLGFSCATEGAEFHYTISDPDVCTDALNTTGEVQLSTKLEVDVYATAEGYKSSDTVHATIQWTPKVEVTKEVIKEVPVEVIVEKEVIKEVEKIVEVPVEVIIEKEVEKLVEVHDTLYIYDDTRSEIKLPTGETITLYIIDGVVNIENAPMNTLISIYTLDGEMYKAERVTETVTSFKLPRNAIYIINVGEKTFKVKI